MQHRDKDAAYRYLECAAILSGFLFALLWWLTPMQYAPQLLAISITLAILARMSRTTLLLLLCLSLLGAGCAHGDFTLQAWTIQRAVVHQPVSHRPRALPESNDLDKLVEGCNAFLLRQRDAAIKEEQRSHRAQLIVAIVGAAVEIVIGSTALLLNKYSTKDNAALVGGIGSTSTGVLSGGAVGWYSQVDTSYQKRRDAIMAAWNALDAYSSAASQPDPARLSELRQKLRSACAGIF